MDRCAAETFPFSPITAVRPYLNQSTNRKEWRFQPTARADLCKMGFLAKKIEYPQYLNGS